MKNLFLLVFSAIIVLSILLSSNAYSQQQQQQQQQNITSTIAEDFKDCFLDFKSTNVFGVGQDLVYLIGLACYETYKSEGKFPDQMSQIELSNITKTLNELQKASDLDKILRAFGQY